MNLFSIAPAAVKRWSYVGVADSARSFICGAPACLARVCTAEKLTRGLHALANDPAPAMAAGRCERVDGLTARERMAECFVPLRMSFRSAVRLITALAITGCMAAHAEDRFDLVIRGGRVVDPRSGLDSVRNVGIRGSSIAAVTEAPLEGASVVSARGLVVAPGFIDLHNHAFAPHSQELRVLDGVTTALELEKGVLKPAEWLAGHAGKSRFNFGASAGHYAARRPGHRAHPAARDRR